MFNRENVRLGMMDWIVGGLNVRHVLSVDGAVTGVAFVCRFTGAYPWNSTVYLEQNSVTSIIIHSRREGPVRGRPK